LFEIILLTIVKNYAKTITSINLEIYCFDGDIASYLKKFRKLFQFHSIFIYSL
jgi:hypothetical protein